MAKTVLESELGDIILTGRGFYRERREGDWDKIEEMFSDRELTDSAHFSQVENFDIHSGEIFPDLRVKIDGEWKRFFLSGEDDVEKIFKEIRYGWKAYRQNH